MPTIVTAMLSGQLVGTYSAQFIRLSPCMLSRSCALSQRCGALKQLPEMRIESERTVSDDLVDDVSECVEPCATDGAAGRRIRRRCAVRTLQVGQSRAVIVGVARTHHLPLRISNDKFDAARYVGALLGCRELACVVVFTKKPYLCGVQFDQPQR